MNGFLLSVAPKAGPCQGTIGRGTYPPLSAQFQPVMEWRLSSNGKDCPRAGFAPLSPPWAGFIILATATGLFILRALGLFILCRGAACSGLLVGATWWDR